MATSIFQRLSNQVAQKFLPKLSVPTKLSKYLPAATSLLRGDISGAAGSLLDQVLGPFLGSSIDGTKLKLSGGITLDEARRIFEETANADFAKKNLWFLSVTNIGGGSAPYLNLFATEVSYAPYTVTGEAMRVGSGQFDKVDGTERVSMRLTTYDDSSGTIKLWFEDLQARIAHKDGTFGLPSEYLVRFTITHASIIEGEGGAYTRSMVMRPESLECDLSRREDALEELQMTFVQFDTFSSL